MKEKKQVASFDWTNEKDLQRFITETGRILPRRVTNFSAKQHRQFTRMVKRARNLLILP